MNNAEGNRDHLEITGNAEGSRYHLEITGNTGNQDHRTIGNTKDE